MRRASAAYIPPADSRNFRKHEAAARPVAVRFRSMTTANFNGYRLSPAEARALAAELVAAADQADFEKSNLVPPTPAG